MSFLKGSIRMVPFSAAWRGIGPMTTIIAISDQPLPDCALDLRASIFLPPAEATSYWLDNMMNEFTQLYIDYLNGSEDVNKYMLAIICAAKIGKDILLVVGKEESEMEFPMIFMEWVRGRYGITMGDDSTPGSFDISYIPGILVDLYMDNLISAEQFLFDYPTSAKIEYFKPLLDKLIYDVNPYRDPRPNSYEDYLDIFNELKNNMKSSPNMVVPIRLR